MGLKATLQCDQQGCVTEYDFKGYHPADLEIELIEESDFEEIENSFYCSSCAAIIKDKS